MYNLILLSPLVILSICDGKSYQQRNETLHLIICTNGKDEVHVESH